MRGAPSTAMDEVVERRASEVFAFSGFSENLPPKGSPRGTNLQRLHAINPALTSCSGRAERERTGSGCWTSFTANSSKTGFLSSSDWGFCGNPSHLSKTWQSPSQKKEETEMPTTEINYLWRAALKLGGELLALGIPGVSCRMSTQAANSVGILLVLCQEL